jgi:hemerythrin-like domain-containing protein
VNAESILLGLIVTLALGGYGYTNLLGRDLRKEIRAIWSRLNNHYAHRLDDVESRLRRLEEPRKEHSDGPR